jgi:hypothetical protein
MVPHAANGSAKVIWQVAIYIADRMGSTDTFAVNVTVSLRTRFRVWFYPVLRHHPKPPETYM